MGDGQPEIGQPENAGSERARRGSEPPRSPTAAADAELADLRRQVDALHRAVRARDDFIAIAAHELRNPMTPILAVAELALKAAREAGDTCPARLVVLLERMQIFVEDFIKRSTRLLEVTRIEAGKSQLVLAPTDLSALMHAVADRYEALGVRGGSPIRREIEDGVHGVLDRLAVEQAVENLVSNALRFGARKPLSLRLGSDGTRAWLEVEDRGPGLSADQQAGLFGRFEQIVAQQRGSGFGIGLWLTNHLVSSMGGDIRVSSREGHGATFTVTLPLAPSPPHRTDHDAS